MCLHMLAHAFRKHWWADCGAILSAHAYISSFSFSLVASVSTSLLTQSGDRARNEYAPCQHSVRLRRNGSSTRDRFSWKPKRRLFPCLPPAWCSYPAAWHYLVARNSSNAPAQCLLLRGYMQSFPSSAFATQIFHIHVTDSLPRISVANSITPTK